MRLFRHLHSAVHPGKGLGLALLLLVAVAVPSVCLLWFMNQAVRNERLAVRQKLLEAYRGHLSLAQERLEAYWRQTARDLEAQAERLPAPELFAQLVTAGAAEAVLCFDAQGRAVYPTAPAPVNPEAAPAAWQAALAREGTDPGAAAEAFARLAAQSTHAEPVARALQAQARCPVQAGKQEAAVAVLLGPLAEERYREAKDLQGRLLVPNAELMALELLPAAASNQLHAVRERLQQRLLDYHNAAMPASQRRFLMHELQRLLPGPATGAAQAGRSVPDRRGAPGDLRSSDPSNLRGAPGRSALPPEQLPAMFPTLAAEDLAAQYLEVEQSEVTVQYLKSLDAQIRKWGQEHGGEEAAAFLMMASLTEDIKRIVHERTSERREPSPAGSSPPETARPSGKGPVLRLTTLPGVWQFGSEHGRVLALYRAEPLQARMRAAVASQLLPKDLHLAFLPPGREYEKYFASVPAGPELPGWRVALNLEERTLFEAAAQQHIASYIWTSVLVVAMVAVLALLALRLVRRQAALTQLRNDLVANVTHELKTPLSSMRLLVDTLLHAPALHEPTVREYLALIAQENARLSRLIDNFLAFSRMERNKRTFDFQAIPAEQIVQAAEAAVRERFNVPGCRFEVRTAPSLPAVSADADAMVTALVNLLDNAYKYSGDEKTIKLSASAVNGSVVFAVEDNGIGLAPRETKRIFKRFYQVDQRLSRTIGGCGLGLSIVKFIVTAHRGAVRVESRPNQGSTFTICLPALETNTPQKHLSS